MEKYNVIEIIFNTINIAILIINVRILYKQCTINKESIEQTKMLSYESNQQNETLLNLSQQKTEMLSKTSRFLEYDNLLNGILYEFYVSRNEILGLDKNTKKIKDVIEQEPEDSLKIPLAISDYKSFLSKFKLDTTFVKLQENGYIFFIKEDFQNTIWEKNWDNSSNLLELHSHLGLLVNKIKELDDIVRIGMEEIEKRTQKLDDGKEFFEEKSLQNIKKSVNKISGKISEYKTQFQESVNILPDKCETYKIIKEFNDNNQT